ncbi:MAG: rhomboid family intramembrane serine protease [Luteolibacter sp.]
MFVLIPYEIETLRQVRPWANWLIVAACVTVSLLALFGGLSDDVTDSLVLDGWHFPGLLGHVLLHGGLMHLIGNIIFLWVFGNAVCTNTNNFIYLILFLACTLLAATVHLIADGRPAIGASGAINGIVGLVLAMYPLNRVHSFWWFLFTGGTTEIRAWLLILFWFAFDVWGAVSGGGGIAYWAHIGGLAGGLGIGLLSLKMGWIELTEYDNRSLLQILNGEKEEIG